MSERLARHTLRDASARHLAVRRHQGFGWGVALLMCCGCQNISTTPRSLGDASLVTGGLAVAAANSDPGACPSGEDACHELPPAELSKVALGSYRLEPPDILIVGLVTTTPKEPYAIHPLDVLRIIVAGTLEEEPIAGDYQVQPGGMLNLGPSYGTVMVQGLTIAEARDAVARQLQSVIPVPDVSLSLTQPFGIQQLNATKIIGPDGMVNLGTYGNVYVAGLTLGEARAAMEERLAEYFEDPKVSLDVFAYNSKFYYVIAEGAGFGDQIFPLPVRGNETVLDAISQIQGLSQVASKRIWIARPAPQGTGCDQVIPVDWNAITRNGNTSTNYQLMPGDRLFIAEDRVYALGSFVNRFLNPVERVLGFTLLGGQAIQTMQRFPGGGLFGPDNQF